MYLPQALVSNSTLPKVVSAQFIHPLWTEPFSAQATNNGESIGIAIQPSVPNIEANWAKAVEPIKRSVLKSVFME